MGFLGFPYCNRGTDSNSNVLNIDVHICLPICVHSVWSLYAIHF